MTTRSHAIRSTLFASIGIYTEYALGMVAAIMIARHLGPGSYGVYGMFVWFAAVGVVFTNSGITTGVIKFVAELRGREQQNLIAPALAHLRRAQRWHLLVVLGLGTILYALGRSRWVANMDVVEFALLVLAVGLRAPYMFNISIAKGYEAFDVTAKVPLLAAPLNLALIAVAMLLHGSVRGFLVAYAASSVVFFLASHFYVARLVEPGPATAVLPAELLRRMRHHLRVVSATVIISFLVASGIEVLFLNLYDGAASAGYFKAAYQLSTGIVLLVPGVLGTVLLPVMASALSRGRALAGRRFTAATTYLVLLAAPVVAYGVVFAGPVVAFLYGPAYAPAAPVFAMFMLAFAVNTVSQGASSLLVSADRQQTILLLTIGFGLLKIVLDVLLIMYFGLTGAVIAVVACSLINSAVYLALAMHVSEVGLEWGRMLHIVLAATVAGALASAVSALHLAPVWTTLLGCAVLSCAYLLLTLLLKCWSKDDIAQLQGLHLKLAAGRPLLLSQLLSWANARAQRGP
jgi:O-antigen/teichoic acid export membrane protein